MVVVPGALLLVREHLVRRLERGEPDRCAGDVVRVLIGVVDKCSLAKPVEKDGWAVGERLPKGVWLKRASGGSIERPDSICGASQARLRRLTSHSRFLDLLPRRFRADS